MARDPRLPRRLRRLRAILTLVTVPLLSAAVLLGGAPKTLAAPRPIVLDGDFLDWDGRIQFPDTYRKDEPEDQENINFKEDIRCVYYATNPGVPWLYFRVDRFAKGNDPPDTRNSGVRQAVYYCVYFDMSNHHTDPQDRFQGYKDTNDYVLYCAYKPQPDAGEPNTHVYLARANPGVFTLSKLSDDPSSIIWGGPYRPPSRETEGNWGQPYVEDTGTGGLVVEFGVPFSAFGSDFGVGQPIQFFFAATLNDPLDNLYNPKQDFCPNTDGIAWQPIPTLGTIGTIVFLAAAFGLACYSMFRGRARVTRNGWGKA